MRQYTIIASPRDDCHTLHYRYFRLGLAPPKKAASYIASLYEYAILGRRRRAARFIAFVRRHARPRRNARLVRHERLPRRHRGFAATIFYASRCATAADTISCLMIHRLPMREQKDADAGRASESRHLRECRCPFSRRYGYALIVTSRAFYSH